MDEPTNKPNIQNALDDFGEYASPIQHNIGSVGNEDDFGDFNVAPTTQTGAINNFNSGLTSKSNEFANFTSNQQFSEISPSKQDVHAQFGDFSGFASIAVNSSQSKQYDDISKLVSLDAISLGTNSKRNVQGKSLNDIRKN